MKRTCLLGILFAGWTIISHAQAERVWEKVPLPTGTTIGTVVYGIFINQSSGVKWLSVNSLGHEGVGGFKYIEPDDWTPFSSTHHSHHDDSDSVEFDDNEIISSDGSCIAIDYRGDVWFGFGNHGISVLSGTSWRHITTISGLCSNSIQDIHAWGEDVWIATKGGLNRYAGGKVTSLSVPECGSDIRCFATEKQGNLWVGTSQGAAMFDGTNWSGPYRPIKNSLASNFFKALTIDLQGNIWASIWDFGIYKFDGTNWSLEFDEYKQINCLAFDKKGHLWAGGVGVWEYDGTSWTKYTKEDDFLYHNNVQSIAIDKDGAVWLGNTNGLTKVYDYNVNISVFGEDMNIFVYPNPVQNQCIITNVNDATIALYTITGQKTGTYHSLNEDLTIDTSTLPSGIYMLKIEKNNKTRFLKISIVH